MLGSSRPARRTPRATALTLIAVGALGALLTGCSGSASDADLPPRLESIRPSETPSPVFAHSAKAQIDARTVSGDGWSIQVPAKFEEQTAPGAEGTTTYRWIAPAAGSQPPLVAVVTDAKPRADAIEQSKAAGVTQVVAGGVTNWQLMVQVNSGLILNALAIAPQADFAKLGLAEVLSTFTPTS